MLQAGAIIRIIGRAEKYEFCGYSLWDGSGNPTRAVVRVLNSRDHEYVPTNTIRYGEKTSDEDQVSNDPFERLLKQNKFPEFDRLFHAEQLESESRERRLVQKAKSVARLLFNEIELDTAQSRILASPAKGIRVTARAGSGKTRCLTALTYFLAKYYGYKPEEVLLLAFNRDAASELEARLIELLGVPAFHGARTFHSLAYGIVQPEAAIIADNGPEIGARQLTSQRLTGSRGRNVTRFLSLPRMTGHTR